MDTDRIKGTARTSFGQLQEDYGRMVGDDEIAAEGIGQQAAGRTQDMFGQAKDGVRDTLDRATAFADDAYTQGRKKLEQGADAIQTRVDANPVMAILMACAAGYVLGLALRLSRR